MTHFVVHSCQHRPCRQYIVLYLPSMVQMQFKATFFHTTFCQILYQKQQILQSTPFNSSKEGTQKIGIDHRNQNLWLQLKPLHPCQKHFHFHGSFEVETIGGFRIPYSRLNIVNYRARVGARAGQNYTTGSRGLRC